MKGSKVPICTWSLKFQFLLLYGQLFLSYWPFRLFSRQVHQNDPKMTLNITRSKIPYTCSTSTAQVTNFSPYCRFQVTTNFEISAPNESHRTLNPEVKGTCAPHVHASYIFHRVPNFNPFCFTASHFRVTDHFGNRAPNDLKMTLKCKRPKVPQTCSTTTAESQILMFCSTASRF